MTDKEYVQPPKKDVTVNKEYVQPPKKDGLVDKEYVQPPQQDELITDSANNENIYESPNRNEQSSEALDKGESFLESIRNHLTPEYRDEYNVRRFFGCLIVFFILFSGSGTLFSLGGLFALIWTFLAWEFWHYSLFSFQGGLIDNFTKNIVYFGSVFSLLWKVLIQDFLILLWITFVAPISGFLTWRKAVKYGKVLYIDNERTRVWRD
ncbi:hypothetical protein ACX4ZB_08020, partial [Aerococcus urinae]